MVPLDLLVFLNLQIRKIIERKHPLKKDLSFVEAQGSSKALMKLRLKWARPRKNEPKTTESHVNFFTALLKQSSLG